MRSGQSREREKMGRESRGKFVRTCFLAARILGELVRLKPRLWWFSLAFFLSARVRYMWRMMGMIPCRQLCGAAAARHRYHTVYNLDFITC